MSFMFAYKSKNPTIHLDLHQTLDESYLQTLPMRWGLTFCLIPPHTTVSFAIYWNPSAASTRWNPFVRTFVRQVKVVDYG